MSVPSPTGLDRFHCRNKQLIHCCLTVYIASQLTKNWCTTHGLSVTADSGDDSLQNDSEARKVPSIIGSFSWFSAGIDKLIGSCLLLVNTQNIPSVQLISDSWPWSVLDGRTDDSSQVLCCSVVVCRLAEAMYICIYACIPWIVITYIHEDWQTLAC